MNTLTTNQFEQIVLNNTPLIDVRAPIEYEKGAFHGAINLPILNTEERHRVGTCYKEHGNETATKLGYKLVSGEIKAERVQAWVDYFTQYPEAIIYCFRGGSRSRISQEWISEALGRDILRIEGGYKAFRNYLINALTPEFQTSTPIILGGYTGSGKTLLLHKLHNKIDLEGLANHRGSSFGKHVTPQPTQINFENNLAYALIKHRAQNFSHMILEDEGRHVGHNFIPLPLAEYFSQGNLVVLQTSFEERVQNTLDEYVINAQAEYILHATDTAGGLDDWYTYIKESMSRLQKRLGGSRFQEVCHLLETAYDSQCRTGSYEAHRDWITVFLRDYYDPMYAYQLKNTSKTIVFEGNASEVMAYFSQL
ncbi:MAG: tRNA 2-selenouridine(34) synthase MnmH [Cellulosilyticaceae bacterium]